MVKRKRQKWSENGGWGGGIPEDPHRKKRTKDRSGPSLASLGLTKTLLEDC
jgi:hypothetical protein